MANEEERNTSLTEQHDDITSPESASAQHGVGLLLTLQILKQRKDQSFKVETKTSYEINNKWSHEAVGQRSSVLCKFL